jgi:predicted dehydrogenase
MKARIAIAGLGKMGVSHFAIANAHPEAEVVAVCDSVGYLTSVVHKYTNVSVFSSFAEMLRAVELDAVVIATPTDAHAAMVELALQSGLHVFCEKPFCLDVADGRRLSKIAEDKGLVNQVGYHYRFVSTFQEAKRLVDCGALGHVSHVLAEAYGPVVLRPQVLTWRTSRAKGGGCLYDYAAHPINLLNWMFGAASEAQGSVLSPIFSREIEDSVFSTLFFPGGVCAQVSVNWSDESYRKMSTKLTIYGKNGSVSVDRQEIQVYLRDPKAAGAPYIAGWTVRNITELTDPTWFYLRGEEYSAQIEQFVGRVNNSQPEKVEASFASAVETDATLAMISANAAAVGRRHEARQSVRGPENPTGRALGDAQVG